ncbi:MAG: hypothetical protein II458_05565 [Oscillospiraceae bacterium]|nr:hypothetical protein [Oscillospiraceae bacterium]
MKETGKRIVTVLVCVMLLVCLLPVTAFADSGPKPSVSITLENMDGRVCYGTLLSRTESTGPAHVWDGSEENIQDYGGDHAVWQAFAEYRDADGYYFLQQYWRCDETRGFTWGYYPPRTFKILLYFPETGEFVSSGVLERYAFDSYYTANLADGAMTVRRSFNYTAQIVGLAGRMIITILIELGVALLFGFRGRKLLGLITVVNVVTQLALNAALFAINYAEGPWAMVILYVPLELAVIIVEAAVYCLTFRRVTERKIKAGKIILYALAANVASFVLGWVISRFVPFLF